jgi:hypothetical protein
MKETYQPVEIEIITFDEKDVITTSICEVECNWEGELG